MYHQALKLTKMKVATTAVYRIFNTNPLPLLRHLSTTAAATTKGASAHPKTLTKRYLFQKLYGVGSTGGKVSQLLHHFIRSGHRVCTVDLHACFKDLRRNGRYQQCLEILDWFEKSRIDPSGRDFALRIDILHKLKGLAEAEKYFDGIPSDFKKQNVYGTLLNCYSADLETDKALATFKKMEEMGFASNVLAFNNILNLYVKTKQLEKVPELISEMKKKQVPLSGHTYSFWIQSYRRCGDLEGVERVFREAQEDSLVKDDWLIHTNVASVFIEVGQFDKALSHLEILKNLLNNSDNPSRLAFQNLISLYAGAGNLDSVMETWNTFKSKFKVAYKQNYASLIEALSRLDDIKGLKKYFQEWESTSNKYDGKLLAVVIGAYLRHDMVEEAELLLKDATEKAGNVLRSSHVKCLNYYFEKGDTESALKHMEAAIVSKWKPLAEKLDPCFQHFKDEKDVDGAEKFCQLLRRAQALDTKAYQHLLETYVAAEKTAPDMRERIKEDGISVTLKLEGLLERVCPYEF